MPGRSRRVRGPHIYVRVRDGQPWRYAYFPPRRRISLHTTDPREADRLFRELCGKFAPGSHGTSREATIDDIAEEYTKAPHGWKPRTLHSCQLRAASFVASMAKRGAVRPAQITDAILSDWITSRQTADPPASAATINRDLVVARRMLAWAAKLKPPKCAPTPLATRDLLSEPKRQPTPLIPSPREVSRVVAWLDAKGTRDHQAARTDSERDDARNLRGCALLLTTALSTGLRLDELRHLREADCAQGAVCVVPHDGWSPKNWQERRVTAGPRVLAVAQEFCRWFADAKGANGIRLALGEHWINERIDAACADRDTGVASFRMHDLRRTFVTELVRAGVKLTVVRDLVGHRDLQTTERYLGRYREDAEVRVPDLPVLDALAPGSATVVPLAPRAPGVQREHCTPGVQRSVQVSDGDRGSRKRRETGTPGQS